jgi:hypothetical protein
MIDPDRVLKMAYLPGEKVRVELGFQWDGSPSWTPSAATAHFRRFSGARYSARRLGPHISLVGREFRQGTEGEEAYTSVELEGVIPGSIAPGIYECKSVHFQVPGRGWVLVFENLRLSITVVNDPSAHREKEGVRLFGVRFLS